jgi:hypothetical protein
VEVCGQQPKVFFRADDIGYPSKGFAQLISMFIRHRMPLCLALVPVWTTSDRIDDLRPLLDLQSKQWSLHQHGYAHRNHELKGKKAEFGSARDADALRRDLLRGRDRLGQLLGKSFFPVFTPPWNRCSAQTLDHLKTEGYHAVSRNRDAIPASPGLPDIQVTVDLHTRRETSPSEKYTGILRELEESLARGVCGIMIHHRRMNPRAFAFLEMLLVELSRDQSLSFVQFQELLGKQ